MCLTAGARPPLTSVDMNLEELGRAAARALFAALDGCPPPAGLEAHPCRLVVLGSTARLGCGNGPAVRLARGRRTARPGRPRQTWYLAGRIG